MVQRNEPTSLILSIALLPVKQILKQIPKGPTHTKWKLLAFFIHIFILGYILFVFANQEFPNTPLGFLVPVIFFTGAIFVYVVCSLSLRTANDIIKIAALEKQSVTDPLLGIYNRRYADEKVKEQTALAARYNLPFSLFILDIDHFKQVNDRYGHTVGDNVLRYVSKIISVALRESDIFARYGGEEFLGIFPNTNAESAFDLAERIRKLVAGLDIDISQDRSKPVQTIQITVSIGISSFSTSTNELSLVDAADKALYQAKQNGRNQTVLSKL